MASVDDHVLSHSDGAQGPTVREVLAYVEPLCHEVDEAQRLFCHVLDRFKETRDALEGVDTEESPRRVATFVGELDALTREVERYCEAPFVSRVLAHKQVVKTLEKVLFGKRLVSGQVDGGLVNMAPDAEARVNEWAEPFNEAAAAFVSLVRAKVEDEATLSLYRADALLALEAAVLLSSAHSNRDQQQWVDNAPAHILSRRIKCIVNSSDTTLPEWFLPRSELQFTSLRLPLGSFVALQRGTWSVTAKVVVHYIIHAERLNDMLRQQFTGIVDQWFTLSHPYVLKLYGACHVTTKPFLVLEDTEEGSLASLFKRDKSKMWRLLFQTALAIEYLHSNKIIHGALRLDNILVGSDGYVRLANFGIAKFGVLRVFSHHFKLAHVGAQRWRAPEALVGMACYESDVYSFALTIIEAISGKTPYETVHDDDAVTINISSHILPERPERITDEIWDLVERMTASDPAERATIQDAIAVLNRVATLEINNDLHCRSTNHEIVEKPRLSTKEGIPRLIEMIMMSKDRLNQALSGIGGYIIHHWEDWWWAFEAGVIHVLGTVLQVEDEDEGLKDQALTPLLIVIEATQRGQNARCKMVQAKLKRTAVLEAVVSALKHQLRHGTERAKNRALILLCSRPYCDVVKADAELLDIIDSTPSSAPFFLEEKPARAVAFDDHNDTTMEETKRECENESVRDRGHSSSGGKAPDASSSLLIASKCDLEDLVKQILPAGADSRTSSHQTSALRVGCEKEAWDEASLQYQHRADVHAQDHSENQPLHVLIQRKEQDIVSDEMAKILQSQMEKGASWDSRCDEMLANGKATKGAPALREGAKLWTQELARGISLTNLPIEAFRHGALAARAFVSGRKNVNNVDFRRKVCVLGARNWGKTSLIKALCDVSGSVYDDQNAMISRVDVQFEALDDETDSSNTLRQHYLTFCDFHGDEEHQPVHAMFFSERTLFFVCVDLHAYSLAMAQADFREDSDSGTVFDRLLDEFASRKIFRWIRLVLINQPDGNLVLVGTKTDSVHTQRCKTTRNDVTERLQLLEESWRAELDGELSVRQREYLRKRGERHKIERLKVLKANASNLTPREWLLVSCKREAEALTAVKKIVSKTSEKSFKTPPTFAATLGAVSRFRNALLNQRARQRVQRLTVHIASKLELTTMLDIQPKEDLPEILRTLHGLGEVVWFHDLDIDQLKKLVILDPLLILQYAREVLEHTGGEKLSHPDLVIRSYWSQIASDSAQLRGLKQAFQHFNLAYPPQEEMTWDSDLLVPALWRMNFASYRAIAGLPLSLEEETVARVVRWEYCFMSERSDMVFDRFVVKTHTTFSRRLVGPWGFRYERPSIGLASRVVVKRSGRSSVIRLEAIATETAQWGQFERTVTDLESVLLEFPSICVTRSAIDDKDSHHNLENAIRDCERSEPSKWMPLDMSWYRDILRGRPDPVSTTTTNDSVVAAISRHLANVSAKIPWPKRGGRKFKM